MIDLLPGVVLLIAMGSLGVALLRRAQLGLEPLEQLAYGAPLGNVVGTLAILLLAIIFGLSTALVLLIAFACAVGAGLLWPDRPPVRELSAIRVSALLKFQEPSSGLTPLIPLRRISVVPTLLIGVFVVRWFVQWRGMFSYDGEGLWVRQTNVWADWAVHLGDLTSFVYGDNFPPQNPRFAGPPHAYHYLADLTPAAMVKLGTDPVTALTTHSFLFSVLFALGLYAFGRRLTRDRGVAGIALVLFLIGGGLGWLGTVEEINRTHRVWESLQNLAWDATRTNAGNFRWGNQYHLLIEAQRAYLYGLPLGMLILTMLFTAVQTGARTPFIAAGIIAGLLPLAHLNSLLALALVTPFLFLLFPLVDSADLHSKLFWRPARLVRAPIGGWILFFGLWIAIAVPQLYLQQGGGRGATAGLRFEPGWIAAPDAWGWFWLKNLGWFLPLLLVALAGRGLIEPLVRRFLWAFMPIFAIANSVVFQPWAWDNIKLLLYWFLAVCILVAVLLVKTWREHPAPIVRFLVATAVGSMILSGLLLNLDQLLSRDRYLLLSSEEIQVAEAVRMVTPPHALFAIGLQHNHPIPLYAGRSVLTSFPGFLWTQSLDTKPRERALRDIYALSPNAGELIRKYGVDYVVIGPNEREEFRPDEAAFRARFPIVISTANYTVFAVNGSG